MIARKTANGKYYQNYLVLLIFHLNLGIFRSMYLLLGKYESNSIALKLYADTCDEIIIHYDQLVALMHKQRGENPSIR